jgi:membrane associated rhomboid family serine protease
MIPIRDDNPTLRTPVITIAIIAVNVIAWLAVQGAGTDPMLGASVCNFGVIPGELTQRAAGQVVPLSPTLACAVDLRPDWYTLLTSMFMHGGWMHLIGNMWFLWIFGNNVEDSMGRGRFVVFYLLSGLAAAAAQILSDPASPVPMVGASGAIGGVMGAYVVLYPRVAVDLFVPLGFIFTTVRVPAFFMLGYWFVLQLVGALPQLRGTEGGVAFWAHLGGFIAGVILVFLFRDRELVEAHRRAIGTGAPRQPRWPRKERRSPW